jgi:hypothetical protein
MARICLLLALAYSLTVLTHSQVIEKKAEAKRNSLLVRGKDLRRAPQKSEEPKCGTAEMNYHPCTSKSVANKLFSACCEL